MAQLATFATVVPGDAVAIRPRVLWPRAASGCDVPINGTLVDLCANTSAIISRDFPCDHPATELIEHVQSLLPAARRKNLSPPASPALTPRSLRRSISFKDTCHPQAEECREAVCEAVPPASSRRAITIQGESSVPVRRTLSEQPRSIGHDGTVAAVAVVKLQLDPALTEAAPDDFILR